MISRNCFQNNATEAKLVAAARLFSLPRRLGSRLGAAIREFPEVPSWRPETPSTGVSVEPPKQSWPAPE
jgi:hypothetical protein